MLEVDALARCSIQSLTEDIQTLNSESDVTVSFSGFCCNGGYVVAESVLSSYYQATIPASNTSTVVSDRLFSGGIMPSSKQLLNYDVTSSQLTVEENTQSPGRGRITSVSSIRSSDSISPKRRSRSYRLQLHKKSTETIHKVVETVHRPDRVPAVDEKRSVLQFRSHVPQVRSTRSITDLHDIEKSSLSLNQPSSAKVHTNGDLNFDVRVHEGDAHSSDGSSEVTQVYHAESSASSLLGDESIETHVQAKNIRDQSPVLQLPSANDKRTVNEVLRQWLANFDPSTYRKIMTAKVLTEPSVLMYRLGETRREPELSSFYTALTENYDELDFWTKISLRILGIRPGDPEFTNYFINVVEDTLHVMDGISAPYVEYGNNFACFYPEGILPIYDDSGTVEMQGLRSFKLLNSMRYQVLQWWHDVLTAPRHTWTKKLRESSMFCISTLILVPEAYTSKMVELISWSETQGVYRRRKKQRGNHLNTYRHINAALHYCCRPSPSTTARTTLQSRAKQRRQVREQEANK